MALLHWMMTTRMTTKLLLALLLTFGLAVLSMYRTYQLDSSKLSVVPTGRLPAALMVSHIKSVPAKTGVVLAGNTNHTEGADARFSFLRSRLQSNSDNKVAAFNGSSLTNQQTAWNSATIQHETTLPSTPGKSVTKDLFREPAQNRLPVADSVIDDQKAKFLSNAEDARLPSSKDSYFLVVLVHSALNGTERRNVIRSTWLSSEMTGTFPFTFWFVLGVKGTSLSQQQLLTSEQSENGDLLMLWDVYNNYESLSERTLHSTHYIYSHYDFTYFLKTDDDMILNMPVLFHEMEHTRPRTRLYWGSFSCHNPPQTDGRWLESSWHSCDVYFPYAYGGMYVLTRDVVRLIANNAPSLQLYTCEDVSMGSWLAPYNLYRVNDIRIFIQHGTRCSRGFIAIHIPHRLASKLILKFYTNLKKKGVMCSTLVKTEMLSWTSMPDQCWAQTVTLI